MAETIVIPDDFKKLLETQFSRVSDQIAHLSTSVDRSFAEFRKILDDHEDRLRKQHDVDGQQGKEIGEVRVELAKIGGQIIAMQAEVSSIRRAQEMRSGKELDFWQRVGLEAIRVAVFGGAMGGVVVAAMRAMGVI